MKSTSTACSGEHEMTSHAPATTTGAGFCVRYCDTLSFGSPPASGDTFTRMPRRRGRRMMCAVRRIKGHPVAVALLTLIVASLGLEPMAAVASAIRPSAWYRASGRQPHFSRGAFGLQFRVTPDGRRVTLLQPSSIVPVACAPASRSPGSVVLRVGTHSARRNVSSQAHEHRGS